MSAETPQDAREVERRERLSDTLFAEWVGPENADRVVDHVIEFFDREHADLVKRAEDAEAREARLRETHADTLRRAAAALERLDALAESWIGMKAMRSMTGTVTAACGRELRALLAAPDADAQGEGSCPSCGLVGPVAIECPECCHSEVQDEEVGQ